MTSGKRFELEASVKELGSQLVVDVQLISPPDWKGEIELSLARQKLVRLEAARKSAGFILNPLALEGIEDYKLILRAANEGNEAVHWNLRGDFFEALNVTPAQFLDKVQLHHSRFPSRLLLEIAAHRFYLFHGEADFNLRASALAILGHRYLEKPADSLTEAERIRSEWIIAQAEKTCREGSEIIEQLTASGKPVDWQRVRWTVSLATVAAHLSLYEARYEQSLMFFELGTRHTHLVVQSKVSALNFIICAFAEGVIAHMLGQKDRARKVLVHGIESVKTIVQAQNLTENVWVLGDLINVMVAARQCYIAMLRLGLQEVRSSPPVIDADMSIDADLVKGPLSKILASGQVPELADHLAIYRNLPPRIALEAPSAGL